VPIAPKKPSSIKKKYHAKTLSDDGIYLNWIRSLDVSPMFADYVWLNISAFDLAQLGLGLIYDIAPIDFEPYNIDFNFVQPSISELMQGIWVKFERKKLEEEYEWMLDTDLYVSENFVPDYVGSVESSRLRKGVYGKTKYGRSYFDPLLMREFLRATIMRARLLRTPDISYKQFLEQIKEILDLSKIEDKHLYNRLMLLFSAQKHAFILGLSILGYSFLTKTEGDCAVIPFMDADGNIYDVKFRTLDQLLFGFILGVTPLGRGMLMPKNSIFKMEDGKKNPPMLRALLSKIRSIISKISLTAWAYGNYNRPEEMTKAHASERMEQYDMLQWQRRLIEQWVRRQIPPEEANPVKIRQYQNAILQYYGWKAKRHKWGFNAWKYATDDEFYSWWIEHWTAQGLNRQVLTKLFEGAKKWLPSLIQQKLRLGERVRRSRLRLALSR